MEAGFVATKELNPSRTEDTADPADARESVGRRVVRGLLVAAGTLCMILGVVGVLVPVLPTTPFLLVAAACYLRGSRRLYRWLLSNRVFGGYLRRYRNGEGISLRSKILTLAMLWTSLGLSTWLAVPDRLWWVRALLVAIGLGVTTHILRIKTRWR